MEHIYFVYVIELLDGTPLYIGKGKENRPLDHYSPKATSYIANKLRKVGHSQTVIKKLYEGLSSNEAYRLEEQLIMQYGRKDIGTGILYNRSNGGEGSRGHRMPADSIERLRQLNLGKKLSDETKAKLSKMFAGRSVSWGNKIKTALTGTEHTDERKLNQSLAAKRRHTNMTPEQREQMIANMKIMNSKVDRSKPNPMAKACEVLGKQYSNVSAAAAQLGWSRRRVREHPSFIVCIVPHK